MINELSNAVLETAKKNGFYDNERNIAEMLCLIHSEVSEALECDRKGRYATSDASLTLLHEKDADIFKAVFEDQVKDTFEDELADVMIRVMDLAAHKGVNLEMHIALKMRYNSMREYKHGKRY